MTTRLAEYDRPGAKFLYPVIVVVFFASGFAALIYQIVWQRALFTIFGTNVEAMTVVVTGFLFGVGIGSLSGGRLSRTATIPLLAVFGLIEIAIGAFGAISLQVFQWAGARTLHLPTIAATAATLVLVIIPSLFMGATLPILTQYFVPRARNVGRTVGLLYCINTLGSAAACFISAFWLMRLLGMQNSVHVAAAINVLAGITVLWLTYWHRPENQATPAEAHPVFKMHGVAFREQRSNLFFAFLVSVVTAYVSLSYEVIWFRAFIIGTNQTQAFPLILGAYLGGLAVGSCWIRRYFAPAASNTRLLYMLCIVILLSSVLGFSVLPLAAQAASLGGQNGFVFITLLLVFAQTVIAGITFPLLCHVGFTADDKAGFHLSLVYVGNILGSAAGTLITGFILMDFMSTAQISVLLAALGAIAAASVAGLTQMSWPRRAAFIAASLTMVISSPLTIKSLFDHYYERIIYKNKLSREASFVDVVENKSGVVTVNSKGVVYGGGMYDGLVSVDLIDDKNLLIRPLSLALYHPHPREVLMVGLGTGAWAQVLVNNPSVERLTIVEINAGYLALIAKYPEVMTILTNPKVEIHIDDGRRWIRRHPHRKFDAIVQNTTLNFRPNATNLLSAEYLELTAKRLRDGGVLMYNTTGSHRAQRTGCMIFSHAFRVLNVMVASNAPLQLDAGRLSAMLDHYSIDGNPVFDRSNSVHRARLEAIMTTVDPSALDNNGPKEAMETCENIKSRTQNLPLITDDNMGEEW